MLIFAAHAFRGHVELLVDDGRTDRAEADHQRDDLDLLRLPQQLNGPLRA